MNKAIVKFLNLVYLGAAAISLFALCTRPIIDVTLSVDLNGTQIGELLGKALGAGSSDEGSESRVIYRDGGEEISSKFNAERIASVFSDGLHLSVPISVPAKTAFEINNKKVIDELVLDNITKVLDTTIDTFIPPLQQLFREITTEYASAVLTDEINKKIEEYFEGASEVSPEAVAEIFDNVYNLLDGDSAVPVSDLANAIVGEKLEDGTYSAGILSILNEKKNEEGATIVQEYEDGNISGDMIAEEMTKALDSVPGLVEVEYYEVSITEEQFNESPDKYFIKVGDGYEQATAYEEGQTYYTKEATVNDVDTALTTLITMFLDGNLSSGNSSESGESGEESRALIRASRSESSSNTAKEELKRVIRDFILTKIPLDKISDVSARFGTYVPFALLAVIGIFALPWAWFALVTFIRTLRSSKCWTRPGIVIVWAAPQVILGMILTYGSKHVIPFLAEKIDKVQEYASMISFDIRTGCLIPSFVYFAVLGITIFYWFLCRPVKFQYRMEKRLRKREIREKYYGWRN